MEGKTCSNDCHPIGCECYNNPESPATACSPGKVSPEATPGSTEEPHRCGGEVDRLCEQLEQLWTQLCGAAQGAEDYPRPTRIMDWLRDYCEEYDNLERRKGTPLPW